MKVGTRIVEHLLDGTPTEWIGFIVLVAGIAGAVWCVARYRASLRDDADHEVADHLLAKHVRELHERGEVTTQEYRSLKQRVNLRAEGSKPPTDRSTVGQHRGSASQ